MAKKKKRLIGKKLFCEAMGIDRRDLKNLDRKPWRHSKPYNHLSDNYWYTTGGELLSYTKVRHRSPYIVEHNTVNVSDLVKKTKLWAMENDYVIQTGPRLDGTKRWDILAMHKDTDIEDGDCVFFHEMYKTEEIGVFKAAEWIRKKLKKKNKKGRVRHTTIGFSPEKS